MFWIAKLYKTSIYPYIMYKDVKKLRQKSERVAADIWKVAENARESYGKCFVTYRDSNFFLTY